MRIGVIVAGLFALLAPCFGGYAATTNVLLVKQGPLMGASGSQTPFTFSLSGNNHTLDISGTITAPGNVDLIVTGANDTDYSHIPSHYVGRHGELVFPDIPAGDYKVVVFGKTAYSGFSFEVDDLIEGSEGPFLAVKVGLIDGQVGKNGTRNGSGTLITCTANDLALTASHVVYGKKHGFLVSATFTNIEARYPITQMWVLAGYNPATLDKDFEHDFAVARISKTPAISYVAQRTESASIDLLKPQLGNPSYPFNTITKESLKEFYGYPGSPGSSAVPPILQTAYSRGKFRILPVYSAPVYSLLPDGPLLTGGFSGGPVLVNIYVPTADRPVGYEYREIGIIVGSYSLLGTPISPAPIQYDTVHLLDSKDLRFLRMIDGSIRSTN